MKTNSKKVILSSIALILTACIWGFSFVVMKDSLDYIGPFWIIAIRFTLSALILFLACIPRLKKIDKTLVLHGFILGIFFFLAYITQTIGCKYTTAGKNAFLTAIYVVLVPILGFFIVHTKLHWYVLVAAVMSITGIALLALKPSEASIVSINKGDAFTLVCGVFFALHIIFCSKYVEKEDPFLLTAFQFLTTGIFSFALAPFFDTVPAIHTIFSVRVIISLLYLVLFASIFGFVSQNVALKFVPSSLASLFLGLESVFGIIFSVIFTGENLSARMICGCVLIFCAILVAEVFPNIKKKA